MEWATVPSGGLAPSLAVEGRPSFSLIDLGASCAVPDLVRFRVWAPACRRLLVELFTADPAMIPLEPSGDGYFAGTAPGGAGLRYALHLDGDRRRPDPASRSLPQGVHGPCEVVDTARFDWTDAGWRGRPLSEMILYEVHVGTFTPEGTFDAVIPRLERLCDLGVTAIELMPVASFPGTRNWGYDGVGLFAPQWSYGGPAGLQRLVNACHAHGLAVVLDVVYNHLGPEGNYLAELAPYFTDRYPTPWGPAMNFDGGESRGVRDFVIGNALFWVREYHIDGLRLDAVHGIFDAGPVHILHELNDAVQSLASDLGRIVPVIAESDLNDRRVIDPVRNGGYGLAGQWNDDFHHCVHALLTGERTGYYEDFGGLDQLAKAYTDSFVYDGGFSAYRQRPHGSPSGDIPAEQFVVFGQNHDQVGNRAWGDRLGVLTDFEGLKLAATAVLVSPGIPLLFMGEEYGDPAPFLFFTDFQDPALGAAVTRGRREEFAPCGWEGEIPDPQDPATFSRSKLTWTLQDIEPHRWLRDYYRTLLTLRGQYAALSAGGKESLAAHPLEGNMLVLHRHCSASGNALILLRFAAGPGCVAVPVPAGRWRRLADSAEERFGGLGPLAPAAIAQRVSGPLPISLQGHEAAVYLRGEAEIGPKT
jgi:maltooligosyltrehalose trehalohydrolase